MSEFYKLIKVKENVYRITSVENVFCELLVGTEKAMLIDTGYGFGNLEEVVRNVTEKPLIIVNTHGHVDHTSGNCQFKENVYISQQDMELCIRHNTKEMRKKSAMMAEHVMDYASGKEIYGLPEDFEIDKYTAGDSGHLIPVEDGTVFELGGITVQVLRTPGHTKGGISLWYQEENWLYVGDAANGFVWLFDEDATDLETHIKSLDKIIALHPEKIFGGHMPQAVTIEEVKRYRKAAEEADYDKGIPFQTPIMPGIEARICPLEGMTLEDMGKPEFASIVIDKTRKKEKSDGK